MSNKIKAGISVLLMGVMLTSCITDPNFVAYVKAHRLAYDARKDTYISLVDASSMPAEDKAAIKSKEQAEDATITSAEKYLGIKK